LKFESRFVHFEGDEIHARTTTGGANALDILGTSDVTLRFPHRMDFLEAHTKLLGTGIHDDATTIRFSLPVCITANETRKSQRIGLPADAFATFNLRGQRVVRASLANISATGARLATTEDIPSSGLRVRDKILLLIQLPNCPPVKTSAIIRNVGFRSYGAEFDPALSDSDLTILTDWAFQRHERELELMADRADMSAKAAHVAEEMEKNLEEGGILLITSDNELDMSLSQLLGEDKRYIHSPPSLARLSDALAKKPNLAILHLADNSILEQQLMDSLTEIIPLELPIILLGTNIENELLMELGRKCKAVTSILWAPSKAVFMQRLVLGILRKFEGQGESPMVPLE
jgi:hypothetical protein